ncbi:hypothetical protein ASF12_13925 [Paenibacillus sp. Leaf72]|nr:hypothetical protein ASF12_13925 [Paenibacillus sp. Leaf72]
MKAITIIQPWATLIAIGAKQYETRGWSTKHRGALAIHAGSQKSILVGMRKAVTHGSLQRFGGLQGR